MYKKVLKFWFQDTAWIRAEAQSALGAIHQEMQFLGVSRLQKKASF